MHAFADYYYTCPEKKCNLYFATSRQYICLWDIWFGQVQVVRRARCLSWHQIFLLKLVAFESTSPQLNYHWWHAEHQFMTFVSADLTSITRMFTVILTLLMVWVCDRPQSVSTINERVSQKDCMDVGSNHLHLPNHKPHKVSRLPGHLQYGPHGCGYRLPPW